LVCLVIQNTFIDIAFLIELANSSVYTLPIAVIVFDLVLMPLGVIGIYDRGRDSSLIIIEDLFYFLLFFIVVSFNHSKEGAFREILFFDNTIVLIIEKEHLGRGNIFRCVLGPTLPDFSLSIIFVIRNRLFCSIVIAYDMSDSPLWSEEIAHIDLFGSLP